jgi:hypothetical protein
MAAGIGAADGLPREGQARNPSLHTRDGGRPGQLLGGPYRPAAHVGQTAPPQTYRLVPARFRVDDSGVLKVDVERDCGVALFVAGLTGQASPHPVHPRDRHHRPGGALPCTGALIGCVYLIGELLEEVGGWDEHSGDDLSRDIQGDADLRAFDLVGCLDYPGKDLVGHRV